MLCFLFFSKKDGLSKGSKGEIFERGGKSGKSRQLICLVFSGIIQQKYVSMTIHVKYYCKKAGDHSSTIYHYQNLSHCWDAKCKVTSNKLLAVVMLWKHQVSAQNLYLTLYKQTNKLLNCSQKKKENCLGRQFFYFQISISMRQILGKNRLLCIG